MLKSNEIRNMTAEEIENKIESMKKDLYSLRTEASSGRIEKPHRIREMKCDIARCETILKEKADANRIQK